jgi:3-phosphoshikimate 1-carboxyvinyltransferase
MSLENSYYNTQGNKDFRKSINVPTSKSFANRALILAAISDEAITLHSMPKSTDVINMIRCLRQIGLDIVEQEDTVIVKNSFPECEIPTEDLIELVTGDGGTTNRFLIPLLALGENCYSLIASEKMVDRPMDELDEVLTSLGVEIIRDEDHWFALKGPYQIDRLVVEVDCSVSTQFATGLALSLSKLDVDVEPINLKTSTPYWEMTVNLIESFREGCVFDVPVDFSSLSYPLALACHSGDIIVSNCKGIDRFQADSALIYILEELGINLAFSCEGLHVKGIESISSFEKDCRDCPDLVPTLCFLASYAQGETKLYNVDVLRHKECDRLAEMQNMLESFGVEYSYDKDTDTLIINGGNPHSENIDYHPPVDHRMVMVAYLFQRFNGGGRLENSHCVEKSFPNFFEVMEK